jgi:ribosomal protein L32
MTIIKCPTNCEDDYLFAHSIITTSRNILIKGIMYRETTTFVVCRECGHWIASHVSCNCCFQCHEQSGGTERTIRALNDVD